MTRLLTRLPFLGLPLVGIGLIASGFFVDPQVMTDDGLMRARTLLFLLGGFFVVLPIGLVTVFKVISRQKKKRKQFFLENGIEGTATVLSYDQTGTYVNNNPQLAFELRVQTMTGQTFTTHVKKVVALADLPKLRDGMDVPAYVHPEKENEVWLDWSEVHNPRNG